MYKLLIHPDAAADLKELWLRSPQDAARIEVLLQEVGNDQRLLEGLTEDGFGEDEREKFGIQPWRRLWNTRLDIWRLKPWNLEKRGKREALPYRVIYAYEIKKHRYHVLAIKARKEIDYDDEQQPLAQRVLRAYHDLAD